MAIKNLQSAQISLGQSGNLKQDYFFRPYQSLRPINFWNSFLRPEVRLKQALYQFNSYQHPISDLFGIMHQSFVTTATPSTH